MKKIKFYDQNLNITSSLQKLIMTTSTKSFKVREKLPTNFATLSVGHLIANTLNLPSVPKTMTQQAQQGSSSSSNTGILYSNSGVLLYKAPDGTITFIANS